jgi:hypothetical protein
VALNIGWLPSPFDAEMGGLAWLVSLAAAAAAMAAMAAMAAAAKDCAAVFDACHTFFAY